jgi:hypothetical protein
MDVSTKSLELHNDLGVKDTPAIDRVPRDWPGHLGLLSTSAMIPAGRGCTRTLYDEREPCKLTHLRNWPRRLAQESPTQG